MVAMEFITKSEQETTELGRRLGETLGAGDVVALRGGLGAGKTAFTKGIAGALGVSAAVTSPTYTIVCEYDGRLPLFHFDAYRLGSSDELFEIGWDEYLTRGGVAVVEWSEIIEDALPPRAVTVAIEHLGGDERRITLRGCDLWD